jgi:hypothetical protein
MPVVSQAQNRWAHWAEKNASGSEQAAAKDFVSTSHGMSVKKLPMRVGKKTKVKPPSKPRIFGSLAPHDNGHELGVESGDY